jgi:GNAT superfamily N-acetyltransferase
MIDITRAAHEAETVRKARPDELGRLAAVLARAFYDDPPIRWVITDDGRRRKLLERSFGLYLHKLWFKQDACYTTGSVVGAIVWERPGQWKVGVLDQLRLLPSMARINGRLLPQILRAIAALESNHPVEPHYYLPLVGVDPEWQGRGLGTALMRPIVERCDTEKVPAYLEATTPRNRALYARHGFEATEQFSLGPGSPPLWRMWRTPIS